MIPRSLKIDVLSCILDLSLECVVIRTTYSSKIPWVKLIIIFWVFFFLSLHKDIFHGFDMLLSIIWNPRVRLVSASVGVTRSTFRTKSNPWVAWVAFVFKVANNTNPCFGIFGNTTTCIKPLLVAVELQRGPWTNQWLPCLTTQRNGTEFSVSNQRVRGVTLFVDDSEPEIFIPRQILAKDVLQ